MAEPVVGVITKDSMRLKRKRTKPKKSKKKWMQKAFAKNKGALHKQLKVPAGETIPASKLKIKPGDSLKTKRRKRLAQTAGKISRKKS